MNITPNQQYTLMLPEITKNRDSVEGAHRIKSKRSVYLIQPGNLIPATDSDKERYTLYLNGAEFHEFPGETLSALLGKLAFTDTEVELPTDLEYLINNSDGDGMSLAGLMEYAASNIMQAKYHILLAELPGTANIDTNNLSRAQASQLNLKACIRQYTRENLIDWQFDTYDGVKQLTLLIFRETEKVRGEDLGLTDKTTYLVCGLDDVGYYQQRWVESGNQNTVMIADTDKLYPEISGAKLRWIPVEIVSDEELPSGSLPRSGGYLSSICNAALHRYQTSADYKEALRNGVPTLFTKKWRDGDAALFKEINGGRENVVTGTGVVNNLPNEVEVMVEGVALNDSPFINYFDANAKMARALGAKFSDTEVIAATATEANINAGNNNAMLDKLCDSLESAFSRAIIYCGMFNGLWGADQIEENLDSVVITMARDFSSVKMTPQEALAIRDLYQSKLMSLETAVTKLVQGGFTPIKAEEELGRIESEAPNPPTITATTTPTIDNQANSV
jgi:hypothetical protein